MEKKGVIKGVKNTRGGVKRSREGQRRGESGQTVIISGDLEGLDLGAGRSRADREGIG